ncbi:hypothetical protein [Falsiroseomonas sp.]|uniref:hypothetical protein n=1 Tax=Falsiroseomonas sp. TaxID=2870721 RepID=UPI0035642292
MTRTVLRCLLLAALLGGCAEMREAPALSRVPPGLGVASADPVPAMAAEAAAALANSGRGLAGNPAATARAVGQLELVAAEFRRDPRWAPLPTAVETELRTARLEWRAALGIRSGAAPEAVATALGRAVLALQSRDTRAAAAALDPALFEPGGPVTLARLTAPGPLPQSMIASTVARDEATRLGQLRLGGPTGALDPNAGLLGGSGGPVAPSLR